MNLQPKGEAKMGDLEIMKHFVLLGVKVEDKVTGFKGVVVCVSFDLYGCIQGLVNPGQYKDGKLMDQLWFDVNRLSVKSREPVMTRPNFVCGPVSRGEKGAAEKPMSTKP
jgi:hypothetical protein